MYYAAARRLADGTYKIEFTGSKKKALREVKARGGNKAGVRLYFTRKQVGEVIA